MGEALWGQTPGTPNAKMQAMVQVMAAVISLTVSSNQYDGAPPPSLVASGLAPLALRSVEREGVRRP